MVGTIFQTLSREAEKMKQKKILITGANGFLGRRAAEYYKKNNTVLTPSHAEMDITDETGVRIFFENIRPDIVIHCAAISDTGVCEKNPRLSRNVNLTGSEHIAKAAGAVHAKCLMCSSDQVYFGSAKPGAHTEDETLSPANVYGRHKLAAEESCLGLNPDCVMLRLTWMYDPVSKSETEHSDFMRTLLAALREGKDLLYPVHDLRGITYVWDVIENMEKAFALPGGVYNFGSENDRNPYNTVLEVFRRLELNTERLKRNEEAFRSNPRNISMSTEKIGRYGISFPSTLDGLTRQLL